MQIDFSNTKHPTPAPGLAISCVYKVIADAQYRGSKKAGIRRIGNIAIRTFAGTGILLFHSGERFELPENSLIIVPYAKIASYAPKHRDWSFWWFEYRNGEGLLPENRVLCFDFTEKEAFAATNALEKLRERNTVAYQEASLYFLLLFCSWMRYNESYAVNKYPPELYELVQNIRRYPERSYSITSMAATCNLSRRRFQDVFEAITGQSPKNFIIGVRMAYAKNLLLHTPLSVSAVAEKCGYNDNLYFSRAFTAYWGCPPTRIHLLDVSDDP